MHKLITEKKKKITITCTMNCLTFSFARKPVNCSGLWTNSNTKDSSNHLWRNLPCI